MFHEDATHNTNVNKLHVFNEKISKSKRISIRRIIKKFIQKYRDFINKLHQSLLGAHLFIFSFK